MRQSKIFLQARLLVLVSAVTGSCLGPPYLLVTFHGGTGKQDVNQIFAYSRDGCTLNEEVLAENSSIDLRELRDMDFLSDGR